jgi:DNA primase
VTPTLDRTELDDLKNRVDLAELFRSQGLDLKKRGKNWFCRCPFHEDTEASLSVNPGRNLWKCFSCQAAGDALSFLQKFAKLEFPEAVQRLRELAAGAPRREEKPKILEDGFQRAELLTRVSDLYHDCFLNSHPAQAYLKERGLDSPELWKAFRVGYCDGQALKKWGKEPAVARALQTLGFLTDDLKEHFRGCLVVPLTDPDEGVAGMYGRRLRNDAEVRHLYLPGARQGVLNWQSLKASNSIVLTEGVLDALSCWQAGVRDVTCLHGLQAPSERFLELLKRFDVREVTLCLDGDQAAQKASQRLIEEMQKLDLTVFLTAMPEHQDPNDVLIEFGPDTLKERIKKRKPAAASKSEEPEKIDHGPEGFQVQLGEVVYAVRPMPPFSGRLRVNLRAHRDEKWLQDRFDLYVHRDRLRLLSELVSQLGLLRLEAERQHLVVFREAERWVQAQKQPEPTEKYKKPSLSERDKQKGIEFLRQPDLARNILNDMEALGYVGEENAKLLAYLIGISRKLPKPLSGIVLSQSGVGKSTLTDIIEQLTPPEEVMVFTRITPQALVYMAQEELKGKLLIVEERVGAEAAEYSIRILQSRQELTQAVPLKDPATGKITTQIIRVEGPVAYLETTTDPKINHENATRCFEITLDETEEQTRRIQEGQRDRRLPGPINRQRQAEDIREKHHLAQRSLESVLVFVPFAKHLTFPSKRLRTRRDHERFLCLLEASTFLHQYQREKGQLEDGTPYVLADIHDYELAYALAADVLTSTLHELSRGARDLWNWIREWQRQEHGQAQREVQFTRRDLRQGSQMEDHQLRDAITELVEMEYLEVASGSNGRAYHYRLCVLSEEEAPSGLLSPAELERRLG